MAQEVVREADAVEDDDEAGEIIVTGSRFGGRTATQSSTPVDRHIARGAATKRACRSHPDAEGSGAELQRPRPLASGVGDFIQPPSLRGLGAGELLVLINGKRRHTTADLNSSNGIGRGDVAVDFNAIPTLAMSRIEVLRDGAAAQYGSGRDLGVINMILDRSLGTIAQARLCADYEGRRRHLRGKCLHRHPARSERRPAPDRGLPRPGWHQSCAGGYAAAVFRDERRW
ncbi:TonB-dependent receptor plug domain-containing protein [Sphingomonas aerolata]|uniref:TonB-dependent receptor plug domain-containing protein n=1 Tax=Sphingomonas aerolata TaxID=185951 RepID=UPI002FE141A2